MAFNVTKDLVRNKNKDLLLTDKIPDTEVEQAISDSKINILTRTYERFNSTLLDSQITEALNIAIKLHACSQLIKDNYTDNENALNVAKEYSLEVDKIVTSIVKGKELQSVTGVTEYDKGRVFRTNADNRANSFSEDLKNKYR